MNINLGMDMLRICERAAIIGSSYQGLGDMHKIIDDVRASIDQGLKKLDYGFLVKNDRFKNHPKIPPFQKHYNPDKKEHYDIIITSIESHKTCANGGGNAASFIAVTEKDGFLDLPNLYMYKIAVNSDAYDTIDISQPVTTNIKRIARVKNKYIENTTICVLARKRHDSLIEEIRNCGARLLLIQDGDISASLAAVTSNKLDMLVGIGGVPEGIMTAAAMKCVGGAFQGKIICQTEKEKIEAKKTGIEDLDKIYKIENLVLSDKVILSATGITDGLLFRGVNFGREEVYTYSWIANSSTKTFRAIETKHLLDYKQIFEIMKKKKNLKKNHSKKKKP